MKVAPLSSHTARSLVSPSFPEGVPCAWAEKNAGIGKCYPTDPGASQCSRASPAQLQLAPRQYSPQEKRPKHPAIFAPDEIVSAPANLPCNGAGLQ